MNASPVDKASLDRLKEKTARLSVLSNSGLVLMKFIVGFAIGSVSIISEAIHSSMDLIAAVIAFFSVRKSAEPPDAHHEFGHGKFEDISGLVGNASNLLDSMNQMVRTTRGVGILLALLGMCLMGLACYFALQIFKVPL